MLILDRYFVPLQFFVLIGLARYYQQRIRSTFPIAGVALAAVWALFAIVSTHDLFVMYRGFEAAYNRVLSSGVPPTELSGTWEMDGWAQLQATGYLNRAGIQNVPGAYKPYPHIEFPASCYYNLIGTEATPAIHAQYGLSLEPSQCGGLAGFPPVTYHTWLPPHETSIYVVKIPPSLRLRE